MRLLPALRPNSPDFFLHMRVLVSCLVLGICISAFAQQASEVDTLAADSLLQPVVVKAFAHRKSLDVIPASIGLIGQENLQRFGNNGFLSVFNTIPGVRMEERSPGSFRLSVRGSSLRSPFGIRNVKIYWNGLPLTDPGGNTYLNLLDFNSVQHAEIIRGPGSSMYGAGTGGVVLLESRPGSGATSAELVGGAYGFRRAAGSVSTAKGPAAFSMTYAVQSADGYRIQSAMKRNFFQANGSLKLSPKTLLAVDGFWSDLYYQTPGALTLAQYQDDPAQARPAGGPNAGAVDQKASVSNSTLFGGITLRHDWDQNWTTTLVINSNTTTFRNPAIRNYEERDEKSSGFRLVTDRPLAFGRISFGAEGQSGTSHIRIYQNLSGVKGIQTNDAHAPVRTGLIFGQMDIDLPHQMFLTAGLSINRYAVLFRQTLPAAFDDRQDSKLLPVPRLAISKKIGKSLILVANAGQGFSPPTTAEIFSSTATYNKNLLAETGTSSEAGLRWRKRGLGVAATTYHLSLKNTIVVTRTDAGADYFFNSGRTRQRGIEATADYAPWRGSRRQGWFRVWTTVTRNNYRFVDYIQNDIDYSGNRLTGTPDHTVVAGIDWQPAQGFYAHATATYSDRIPLNDANTAWAPDFYVFALRTGYQSKVGRLPFDVFAGADNLLDRRYSLGNDLNAVGGRYFNAAAGRSWYLGLQVKLVKR